MTDILRGVRGLRGTRGRAARDMDYLGKLSGFSAEWMAQFLHAIPSDDAPQRDIFNHGHRIPSVEIDEDNTEWTPPESHYFSAYRCPRCLKGADVCACPRRAYKQSYGVGDWQASPADPERIMIEAEEAEAMSLLPYGNAPAYLAWGVKVKICLPKHYLNKCTGVVRAYRVWTDQYLIEADRVGKSGEDGKRSATTLCWVVPMGLKLA